MKRVVGLLLCLIAPLAMVNAEEKKKLYKWVDDKGNVHYSDQPQPGAEEIKLQEVPAIKLVKPKIELQDPDEVDTGRNGIGDEADGELYKTVELTEPLDQGVIRNNASLVTLVAEVEPALKQEHTIAFYLDGKPVSKDPKATLVTVENVDYGEHSAKFVILDKNGMELQSSKTSRFSLLNMINPKFRNNN